MLKRKRKPLAVGTWVTITDKETIPKFLRLKTGVVIEDADPVKSGLGPHNIIVALALEGEVRKHYFSRDELKIWKGEPR